MSDPVVTIGGREFPVPELSIYQLREVFPAMGALSALGESPTRLLHISREDFALLLDTIFIGIAPGSPGFTRAEFDKLPAKPAELLGALTAVARQSGMLAAEGKANGAGEDQAAIPSTGTKSSRISSERRAGRGTTLSSA
jgi:hypothetical protein